MQEINVNELKPHPRNTEFFDDMSGEKWEEFLESVNKRTLEGKCGIIETVVITQDKTIVSGHQRVRACKELGIDKIKCEIHLYDNEDQVLQDLIETNIRQRGDVGGSAKKVGKRIKELERLYGIEHGNNQYSSLGQNDLSKTQSDIAKQMDMSVETYKRYKTIADMIPELSTLVDTGVVTKTTALAMMKNLSEQEQEELLQSLPTAQKFTQKEIQSYIDKLKEKDVSLNNKTKEIDELSEKISKMNELESEIAQLKNELDVKPEKEIEVAPLDYDSTKKELKDYKTDYERLHNEFTKKTKELQDLKKQIELEKEQTPQEQFNKKLQNSTLLFCSKVATFIEQVGGYVWLTDHINEIPEFERTGYIKAINEIKNWANTMDYNINNNIKEIK